MSVVRARAFTLIEIVLALGLGTLLLALAAYGGRPQPDSAQVNALAHAFAETLRAAREQAISSGQPLAVVLPGNATRPLAQGCYLLGGETLPRRLKTYDWTGETPRAAIAAAVTYSGPAWRADAPVDENPDADLSTWMDGTGNGQVIFFRPDGRVQSNRPWGSEQLRWVVGNGFAFSGETLTGASRAQEVTLSRWGEVAVASGLPLAPGLIRDGLPLDTNRVEKLPAKVAPGHHAPRFTGTLEWTPKPQPTLDIVAPPSSHVTVVPDGLVTMTVRASDEDGHSLSCRWQAIDNEGSFSAPEMHRMRWDPQQRNWVARWSWRPPADAAPGDQYQLDCRVTDEEGLSSPSLLLDAKLPTIAIIQSGRLAFALGNELWTSNWDYTDPVRLVSQAQTGATVINSARWSPDGRRIAFIVDRVAAWIVNADGTDLHPMQVGLPRLDHIAWDPVGRHVFTVQDLGATVVIGRLPLQYRNTRPPSALEIITSQGMVGKHEHTEVHPSGSVFAVSEQDTTEVNYVWADGVMTPGTLLGGEMTFSPNGLEVSYYRGTDGFVSRATVDPASHTVNIVPSGGFPLGGTARCCRISPDQKWVYGLTRPPATYFLMNRETGQIRSVPNSPLTADPEWSPR
jgi:type II secretory pathway pseudopilin PulG